MVTQKNPADVEQRKVEYPEENQQGNRCDTDDEKQRQRGAAPTEELEEAVACVPPAQSRDLQKPRRPPALVREQEVARGQDALATHQSFDLHSQRNKCGEINQADQTQKKPTGEEISFRPRVWIGEFPVLHGEPRLLNSDEFRLR